MVEMARAPRSFPVAQQHAPHPRPARPTPALSWTLSHVPGLRFFPSKCRQKRARDPELQA